MSGAPTDSRRTAAPAAVPGLAHARRLALAVARRSWLIVLLLAVWWIVTHAGLVASWRLPTPEAVWHALLQGFRQHDLAGAIGHTLLRLVIGWAIGVAAAIVLGIAAGSAEWAEQGVRPLIAGLQSVPTIAFLPLAILWFGFGENAVLAITAFGTFKPMTLATLGAIRQIPPRLRQAALAMGARGLFLQRTLVLPGILPGLTTGFRLSWSFAWRSLMAAEIIVSGTPGLGGVLELGREIQAVDLVIAVIIVISALGVLVEQVVFARVEHAVGRRYGLVAAK